MKKLFAILICLSLLLSMAGCGGGEKSAEADELPAAPEQEAAEAPETSAAEAESISAVEAEGGSVEAEPVPAEEAAPVPVDYAVYAEAKEKALDALSRDLRALTERVYVYRDFSAAENHFTQKALMAGVLPSRVHDIDENCLTNPCSGESCIRCEIESVPGDWGGWLFLNGFLPEGETVPRLNEGTESGQGMDLTGAEKLSFYARGEEGGEVVEFFTCGFGYNGETGAKAVPYPDSCSKLSLGSIRLTDGWERYEIDLSGQDLSCIACGFGFAVSGEVSGERDNVFYLDEICFEGKMSCVRPLLRSYETDNLYIQNAAFTYDNALAAMAFLSEGMESEAEAILDSLVYAMENDRYAPGRIRNAYAAGDIAAAPGWNGSARLPGWYDTEAGAWYEDRYQVGCNVGNTAYAALALLAYDSRCGSETYVNAAARLMDWVLAECSDGRDGFLAGYDGWKEGDGDAVYPFTYKSAEHNIDAYAAFRLLYEKTGEAKYKEAADSAFRFVVSMYDPERGLFCTGTAEDGVTPTADNVVLDAQVWTALAFGAEFEPYRAALDTAKSMVTEEGGYPFCLSELNDGWWAEGTAFTALMWRTLGEDGLSASALNALCTLQDPDGRFPAATRDDLFTGIWLFDGTPWNYGTDRHIAPAAWFVLAVNGLNPYDP